MNRRRLLVVAAIPEPLRAHVDGLRLALGDPDFGANDPHITLVPPVNVREDALDEAFALLRSLADHTPVTTNIGPITTFAPATPVLYLAVTEHLAMRTLRDRVFRPPLSRPLSHEFVPHVTVNRRAGDRQIEHIPRTTAFAELATIDRVEMLEEHTDADGRRWVPLADVHLGSQSVAGRGGLETVLTRSSYVTDTHRRLLDASPDASVVWEASRSGEVVGVLTARRDGSTMYVSGVAVAVDERGTGVGRALVNAARDHVREHECRFTVGTELPLELASYLRDV